jgi:hypothetical protein
VRDLVLGRKSTVRVSTDETRLLPAQLAAAWVESCPTGIAFDQALASLVSVASLVTPNLAREQAVEMWTHVARSPCVKRGGELARAWVELFTAVAGRDADAMSSRGMALLAQSRGTRSAATEYAFLAAMSGHLCQARVAEANRLLEEGTRDWLRPGSKSTELRYLYFLAKDPRMSTPAKDGRCATSVAR